MAHARLAAVPLVWWPRPGCLAAAPGPVRRFWVALWHALSSVAFIAYSVTGVDNLNQYYIGYFFWSAPAIAVLVIALGLVEPVARAGRHAAGPRRAGAAAALAAARRSPPGPQNRLTTARRRPG